MIDERAQTVGRKKLYTKGVRIRAVRFVTVNPDGRPVAIDDNKTVPPGTEGTVDHVDDAGTVFAKWDNGSTIGAILADEIEFASQPHLSVEDLRYLRSLAGTALRKRKRNRKVTVSKRARAMLEDRSTDQHDQILRNTDATIVWIEGMLGRIDATIAERFDA